MPSNKGGCAYYRCWLPFEKLLEKHPDEVDIRFNENPLNIDPKTGQLGEPSKDFEWCDVFFTQNIINFGGHYTLQAIIHAKQLGKFVHFDTDDLLTDLYEGHRLQGLYKEKQLDNITKDCYGNSDLVSVTQKKFAHRISKFTRGFLVVIKNAIDYSLPCWNVPKLPLAKKGPIKIGWVGGIHHLEDVKEFANVALSVNAKVGKENVEWGFYGRPFFSEEQKKEEKEIKKRNAIRRANPNNKEPLEEEDWQQDTWDVYLKYLGANIKNYKVFNALPTHDYGRMYSNIDVAIAPLQMNDFNDSKCFGKGQKVLTFEGDLKKIEEVLVGDVLMGPDSAPRKVLSTTSGIGKMYKVSPTRGKSFYITENHILKLKANDYALLKAGKPQYLELSVKEYLASSKSIRYNYRLYRVGVNFPTQEACTLDPYYVGLMLGDGSLTQSRVGITTADKETKEYFINYSLSLANDLIVRENTKQNKDGSLNKASSYYVYKKKRNCHIPNPVREKFKEIGLAEVACKDKFIPSEYKVSSRKERLDLLAGLLDSDGCLSSSGTMFTFSNKSKLLVDDLAFVGRSLGLYVSPTKDFQCMENTYYRVQITGDINIVPCRLKRKQGRPRKCNRDSLTTSFTLENVGEKEFFGVKVDKDSLHLLDDFMVTHNSEIKLMECGYYKTPLIASNVGCYDETIRDGVNGYLVKPGDTRAWVKVLTRVIKDRKSIKKMGDNLYNDVVDKFNINTVVGDRLQLYLWAIGERNKYLKQIEEQKKNDNTGE